MISKESWTKRSNDLIDNKARDAQRVVDAWNVFHDLFLDFSVKYPEENLPSKILVPISMVISKILRIGNRAAKKLIKEQVAQDLEAEKQKYYERKYDNG